MFYGGEDLVGFLRFMRTVGGNGKEHTLKNPMEVWRNTNTYIASMRLALVCISEAFSCLQGLNGPFLVLFPAESSLPQR